MTNIPGGMAAQRWGRRSVLIVGPAVTALGYLLTGTSQSFWQVLAFRFLAGMGGGAHFVAASVYLRDVSTLETRARYMSLQPLSILIGQSVGPIVGGAIAQAWGLRAPFYFAALSLTTAALLVLTAVPEPRTTAAAARPAPRRSQAPPRRQTMGSLFRSPSFLALGLFTVMVFFNRSGGRFTILPLFAAEKGLTPTQIGALFTLTAVPQLMTVFGAGALADKLGRKSVVMPAVSIVVVGLVTFTLGESYGLLALAAILMGIGEGLVVTSPQALFADIAPRGLEGVTMGLYRTFGDVGFLVGPLLLGWIAQRWGHFGLTLGVDAALLFGAALLLMLLVRETLQRKRPAPSRS